MIHKHYNTEQCIKDDTSRLPRRVYSISSSHSYNYISNIWKFENLLLACTKKVFSRRLIKAFYAFPNLFDLYEVSKFRLDIALVRHSETTRVSLTVLY